MENGEGHLLSNSTVWLKRSELSVVQQPLSRCSLNPRGANGGSASHPPSNWAVQREFLSLSKSIPMDLDGGMNSSSQSSSVKTYL